MDEQRWKRVEEIYHAALECAADRRRRFVDEACLGDDSIKQEVLELLAESGPLTVNFEKPVVAMARQIFGDAPAATAETVVTHRRDRDEVLFAPGHTVGARYRIVSFLGRGGMGEVYRADDLKLGQPIALKFLPKAFASDPRRLARFTNEVRLAREISHPNVCRVFDIGETDGCQFLAMEYVDGETLESLVRRIGQLPREKAFDVAAQLCAGLSAAHDRGVLHCDLKPANIMIDGRGQVRIVDLGIAVERGDDGRQIAGTPAYMAPEQIAGDAVTEQTDVFALGVVLFELFTGQRLFLMDTIEGRLWADPGRIALLATSAVDRAVENVIRACLERDPRDRPASVRIVNAALPTADPLAVALARGRIPSPDLLATTGRNGGVRPAVAWMLLFVAVAGMLGVAATSAQVSQVTRVLDKPPEVLVDRAQTILKSIGEASPAADAVWWFEPDRSAPSALFSSPAKSSTHTRRSPISLVYRQSRRPLATQNSMNVVSESDPPNDTVGIATVVLDTSGRLLRLIAIPDVSPRARVTAPIDWSQMFAAAGLAASDFSEVAIDDPPLVPHDQSFAWQRRASPDDGPPVRVRAATLFGRVVYFNAVGGDDSSEGRDRWFSTTGRAAATEVFILGSALVMFALAGALARRNLRLGVADVRGVKALSSFVFSCGLVGMLLRGHHVAQPQDELMFLAVATAWALLWAVFSGLLYVGLEPYARQWWPSALMSWTRLISGRARDPLIARDIVAGVLAGVVFVAVITAGYWSARRFGVLLPPIDARTPLEMLGPPRLAWSAGVFLMLDTALYALGALLSLVLIRIVLRREWLAITAWGLIGAFVFLLPVLKSVAVAAVGALLMIVVVLRFGLIAFTLMLIFERVMTRVPITLNLSAWYAGPSMLSFVAIGTVTAYGFRMLLQTRLREQ